MYKARQIEDWSLRVGGEGTDAQWWNRFGLSLYRRGLEATCPCPFRPMVYNPQIFIFIFIYIYIYKRILDIPAEHHMEDGAQARSFR